MACFLNLAYLVDGRLDKETFTSWAALSLGWLRFLMSDPWVTKLYLHLRHGDK
jgi:hypothetical protein